MQNMFLLCNCGIAEQLSLHINLGLIRAELFMLGLGLCVGIICAEYVKALQSLNGRGSFLFFCCALK